GLAACSSGTGNGDGENGDGDEEFVIGVAMYGEDTFAAQGKEGMEAYADARGIDMQWRSADYDVTTQATQIEQLVQAGVDGLVVAAVQYDSLAPQLAAAKEADITVGLVNAKVEDTSSVDVSVLPDNVGAGNQVAEMVAEGIG